MRLFLFSNTLHYIFKVDVLKALMEKFLAFVLVVSSSVLYDKCTFTVVAFFWQEKGRERTKK